MRIRTACKTFESVDRERLEDMINDFTFEKTHIGDNKGFKVVDMKYITILHPGYDETYYSVLMQYEFDDE